jgi:hypothetical protein
MDKLVKLAAIEKLAKPMAAFHGKDEEYTDMETECAYACCGKPCESCAKDESEDTEDVEE